MYVWKLFLEKLHKKFDWKNFPEKPLSHAPFLGKKYFFYGWVLMKFTWKNFPENPLSHAPKLQNLKKIWKNFSGYPLSHAPIFGKFFRDLPIWVNLIFNENFFQPFRNGVSFSDRLGSPKKFWSQAKMMCSVTMSEKDWWMKVVNWYDNRQEIKQVLIRYRLLAV